MSLRGMMGAGATVNGAKQNLTTFTEVDPNNALTPLTNLLSVGNCPPDDDAHLYKDFGAGYFGNAFEIDFTVGIYSGAITMFPVVCGVSNVVEDAQYWMINSSEAIVVQGINGQKTPGPTYKILQLYCTSNGNNDSYNAGSVASFTGYCTLARTTSTAVECRIYSDFARTSLLDTLSIACDAHAFRYMFAFNTYYNVTASKTCTFQLSNYIIR